MANAGENIATSPARKLTLVVLTGMVVGSMVRAGGRVLLAASVHRGNRVVGALVAWAIAGTGMLMLAFVFWTLVVRKPALDADVHTCTGPPATTRPC